MVVFPGASFLSCFFHMVEIICRWLDLVLGLVESVAGGGYAGSVLLRVQCPPLGCPVRLLSVLVDHWIPTALWSENGVGKTLVVCQYRWAARISSAVISLPRSLSLQFSMTRPIKVNGITPVYWFRSIFLVFTITKLENTKSPSMPIIPVFDKNN
jgi:hypothetical protein